MNKINTTFELIKSTYLVKYKLVIFILLIFQGFNLKSQCEQNRSVTLRRQSHVDNFKSTYGDESQFDGSVSIVEEFNSLGPITNLDGLNHLTEICGNLAITQTTELETLSGLDGLQSVVNNIQISSNSSLNSLTGLNGVISVGGLSINNNHELLSLSSLNNLTNIGGTLRIESNSLLTSLSGLGSIQFIGRIEIRNSNALQNTGSLSNLILVGGDIEINQTGVVRLTGFSMSKVLGSIIISENNQLTNIDGLQNLTEIRGDLIIEENINLISFEGLRVLNRIRGTLSVIGNSRLVSLSGLENLTAVWTSVFLDDNISISSISSLNNLNIDSLNFAISNQSDIIITRNSQLNSCTENWVCEALQNDLIDITIGGNDLQCNSNLDVLNQCSALPLSWGDITIERSNNGKINNVRWEVVNQIDNNYFEIELASNSSQSFYHIGHVMSSDSVSFNRYYFKLPMLCCEEKYIRLKQVDYDQNYSYSPIINVESSTDIRQPNVYPTVTTGYINVDNISSEDVIKIYTSSGKLVLRINGNNQIDINNINEGYYFIVINRKIYKILKI